VRRPGYPLDRAGAFAFLKLAFEVTCLSEGRGSRNSSDSPIAHAVLVRIRDFIVNRCRQGREDGQAMVEFGLILLPLLLVVVGIIQFGIALNYWLDMQRIANQGARWAAVNNWPPDCARGATSCASPNTLQETLRRQMLTAGLATNPSTSVQVCYPNGTKLTGDPVRVSITSKFNVLPILGFGSLGLRAKATMRLEHTQDPSQGGGLITGDVPCT
jgi:TadE-like protein